MSSTYLFLDAMPSTLQGTHTIHEADETPPALDTSSGPDDTAGDLAGEDTTGEDGEDTLEGRAEDGPDNIEDGAEAGDTEDTPDDPADPNSGTPPPDSKASTLPNGEDMILQRKKRELFNFYAELLGAAENLLALVSHDNLRDYYDAPVLPVAHVIRQTMEASINVLRNTIVEDYENTPYENLLFLYNQQHANVKLASDIFASLQKTIDKREKDAK